MTETVAVTTAPATSHTVADFHKLLVTTLPRLRVQALALTRNRADADDLVQAAVTSALAAKDSFTPGTNFGAWMFRILRNRFISDVRRKRETTDIDDVPSSAFARPGAQEDSLVMRELRGHLSRLPAEQRTALVMVTVQGMSYEEVAAAMDCAVGTAKCRVFRARQTLQRWLTGEERGVDAPKVAASTRKSSSSPRATRRRMATDDTAAGHANPV
ncbi:sigma-70 family RNA polymerase sigma factor [Pararoseomonas sp. SCSIO 73927]|uniref:sigma-70 family RNA polymerase sigma factor n=1 Tax=Pararoseomonas sp. SCSIO 73927 TaxID=3114537 RepID=UPI0030CF4003